MYIKKSNRGFSWYSAVNKDGKGNKLDKGMFMNFVFQRDTEPTEDTLEADIYLIDKTGAKRKVIPYVNEWGDHRSIEFRILAEEEKSLQVKVSHGSGGAEIDGFEPDDLPFK